MNLPKVRPRAGYALVQMDPPENESFGGILIAEIDRESSQTGVVRRIGKWPLNKRGLAVPPPFKVGDRVVVNCHVGTTLDGLSKDFKVVDNARVLAVFEK